MHADLQVAALFDLGEAPHRVIALPGAFFFVRVLQTFDEIREQPDIARLPQ
jgi:hypothetical protein